MGAWQTAPLYKSGHKWGIGQQPALYHKWCSKKIWPEYQENGSEEASEIFANILCKYWPKFCAIFDHRIGFVLSGCEKGRSVFNSLVLFWSCELYSELQNRNKGTNNTLCKLRKLSKLKGDIWKRRKKDRVELQPFSKREFESSKGRNEKGEIKSFLCQKVGRWNSMLRSLSFHEYYILHHQSL